MPPRDSSRAIRKTHCRTTTTAVAVESSLNNHTVAKQATSPCGTVPQRRTTKKSTQKSGNARVDCESLDNIRRRTPEPPMGGVRREKVKGTRTTTRHKKEKQGKITPTKDALGHDKSTTRTQDGEAKKTRAESLRGPDQNTTHRVRRPSQAQKHTMDWLEGGKNAEQYNRSRSSTFGWFLATLRSRDRELNILSQVWSGKHQF